MIAARDRTREPELPEATLARALSTPLAPRLARYDVIVVSNGAAAQERDARIAAEFARHEHRGFHLGNHSIGGRRPAAPTLNRIGVPAGDYMRLVELNQGRFEEKWGICWERHRPLPDTSSPA
jgi:hypothetical protein